MRHQAFTALYDEVVNHLRLRSNLTNKKIRDLAAKYHHDARMVRDTPEDTRAFLKAYRAGLLRQERANTRTKLKAALEMAKQSGSPRLIALLQHEACNAEEAQVRDFLSRLAPSLRSFIEMQVRKPSSVVELEALVMHWCDMSHGRQPSTNRINEISVMPQAAVLPHPTGEPSVHPGSASHSDSSTSNLSSQMSGVPSGYPGTPLDYMDPISREDYARIMAMQRQSAGRHVAGRGRFQRRGQPVGQGQGPPCPHCKGTHPDIPGHKCPTMGAAARDTEFLKNPENKEKDVSLVLQQEVPLQWYWTLGATP